LSFLGERLAIVEAAVSDRTGDARFLDSDWSWGGHLAESGRSSRRVSCVTLDQIVSAYRLDAIDILKVDIEGAEKQVFTARPSSLERVGCVIIELHNGYSIADLRDDLASLKFVVLEPHSEF